SIEGRGVANKLRGLEIDIQTDRLLLLDVDVLVLSDPSGLSSLDTGIAAAPANAPKVPWHYWKRIYSELEIEPPTERIASLSGELGGRPLGNKAKESERITEMSIMPPYYNSGVLFLPRDCDLRILWEKYTSKIAELFEDGDSNSRSVRQSDQAGLAIAFEFLKRRGMVVKHLPHVFHANPLHLYQNALPLNDIKLFHAFRFCNKVTDSTETIQQAPQKFRRRLIKKMQSDWCRVDDGQTQVVPSVGRFSEVAENIIRLEARLHGLYERHIMPCCNGSKKQANRPST
ncbi:hypothetical protein MJD09_10680, partial [bacterium]|nr:hypothetical protein [bacterium]